MPASLGTRLKEARGTRSAASVAREIGTDPSNYAAWEADYSVPKPDKWPSIARFLGCSKAEVMRMVGALEEDETITHLPRLKAVSEVS